MTILFVVLILAACCLLYLSHRHQGWLAQPLAARPWRWVGLLLLLLALACGLRSFSTIAAVFAWLAIPMLVFSVLPFFSLLIQRGRRGES
ncbi:hypothetical protein [Janthinobacterium fluminis]|uniref:DUF3325 domain-containing protein n=1 Tax=Janthinobacterium fluminis TaxID=2987524 RepID=A0ABT5K127_9BURK|nr:hypothetical protein [Janthinobacterium fluminis]MDC8758406.1 hypothetical protein [Janthinobacterium fluminis]